MRVPSAPSLPLIYRKGVCAEEESIPPPPTSNLLLGVVSDDGVEQTSGGSLAAASNDPVGRWKDNLSGANHHLLQATAGIRPTYQTNQVNGMASVRFNGTDQFLKALFTHSDPFHLFAIVRQISWTNNDHLFAAGAGDLWALIQGATTPRLRIYDGAAVAPENAGLAVGTWGRVEIACPSGGTHSLQVNNNAPVTGGSTSLPDLGGITVGAHPSSSAYANVEFAIILLYSAVLTGQDLTDARAYLFAKAGL